MGFDKIMQKPIYHIPALLNECMAGLNLKPDGIYVDVTFGGGGHSREILRLLNNSGHLYAFDQDEDAEQNIIEDKRFTFIRSNFRFLKNFIKFHHVTKIDGILADLGVSFHHFDDSQRGFSFRFEGRLDMRMNKHADLTAEDIINTYNEDRLADILYLYGELKTSRKIASALVKARNTGKIETTEQLLSIVKPFISNKQEKKELAQLFQALRIEVNHEMDSLKQLLQQSSSLLKPGGRLVILTYHSLEDRMVKNFLKTGNIEGQTEKDFYGKINTPFKLINNKVITPSDEEIERNPRSRSAKLRIAEKI